MSKRKFRLLSKVVFYYLLFTLLFFIISAIVLQKEANKHMHNILENRFEHREHRIRHILEEDPGKFTAISSSFAEVKQVNRIPENTTGSYSDTVMMNEYTQRENIYRKKVTYMTVDGKHYKVEMTKEADELYKFRDDVFHIVLPIFLLLALAILVANYLLSGIFFEPFRRILRHMNSYKIGQPDSVNPIKTSTYEFDQLKKLFERMRQRIEKDYSQLKEYTENMSHELQTPLSIIQNKAESLISHNNLNPQQAKQVKAIYEETQQLSRLGRALNLITQIENREFQDIREVKTAPAIEAHLEKIREMTEMKDLEIRKELDTAQTLTMDPGLMDIMIRNLLKNAIRYADHGSTLWIMTANGKMRFMNQGPEPDFDTEEIFDRFRKGRGQKTLGLGLSIVKKICQVSGLNITYDYQEGCHIFEVEETAD
ncbi:MAG TPA: HAMP domain-containing sensor histidine kinase [Bacteroidales bacterium]|nr:HAMP domain-containing sensor histidine kinase [Bacteroidales bacterium]